MKTLKVTLFSIAGFLGVILVAGIIGAALTSEEVPTNDSPVVTTVPTDASTDPPVVPENEPILSCEDADGPIYRGDPSYNSDLDRDNDGVACESK